MSGDLVSEGFTKAEAEEIVKKIESKGWKVEISNLDAIKHDDSVWWYEYDEYAPVLKASKGKKSYEIIATGDITITNPNDDEDYFYFRGGKPAFGKDELTTSLLKNGDWGDNNWFEIIPMKYENGEWKEIYGMDNLTEISLSEIIKDFMSLL